MEKKRISIVLNDSECVPINKNWINVGKCYFEHFSQVKHENIAFSMGFGVILMN